MIAKTIVPSRKPTTHYPQFIGISPGRCYRSLSWRNTPEIVTPVRWISPVPLPTPECRTTPFPSSLPIAGKSSSHQNEPIFGFIPADSCWNFHASTSRFCHCLFFPFLASTNPRSPFLSPAPPLPKSSPNLTGEASRCHC